MCTARRTVHSTSRVRWVSNNPKLEPFCIHCTAAPIRGRVAGVRCRLHNRGGSPRGTFCGDVLRYRFTRFEEAQHLVQQKPAFAGAAALRCSLLLLVEGEVTALDDVADLPGAFQDFLRNFLERAAFEGLEVRALGYLVDRIVHEIFFDAITAADESRFDHEPLRVAPVLEIDRHSGLVK